MGLLCDHEGAQRSVSSYKKEDVVMQETTFLFESDVRDKDAWLSQPSWSLYHILEGQKQLKN